VFEMIDSPSVDGLIDAADLASILRRLGYEPAEGEVEDIIWEVDDDRDGGLTWEEFSTLYERVRNDSYGMEPHRLYTLVEFLMFDLDADGFVSQEECVELFYRRYGRAVLFKKKGVDGMSARQPGGGGAGSSHDGSTDDQRRGNLLPFLHFVKHDIAFYPISRQIEDRRQYCRAQKTKRAAMSTQAAGSTTSSARELSSPRSSGTVGSHSQPQELPAQPR
jgi:hypothetical protein